MNRDTSISTVQEWAKNIIIGVKGFQYYEQRIKPWAGNWEHEFYTLTLPLTWNVT